jgi:hypothetical protein
VEKSATEKIFDSFTVDSIAHWPARCIFVAEEAKPHEIIYNKKLQG